MVVVTDKIDLYFQEHLFFHFFLSFFFFFWYVMCKHNEGIRQE